AVILGEISHDQRRTAEAPILLRRRLFDDLEILRFERGADVFDGRSAIGEKTDALGEEAFCHGLLRRYLRSRRACFADLSRALYRDALRGIKPEAYPALFHSLNHHAAHAGDDVSALARVESNVAELRSVALAQSEVH